MYLENSFFEAGRVSPIFERQIKSFLVTQLMLGVATAVGAMVIFLNWEDAASAL